MNIVDYVKAPDGRLIIVGSGFLWAWIDALFMSVFFTGNNAPDGMGESSMVATFLCCSLVLAFVICADKYPGNIFKKTRTLVVSAILGSAGSLLYLCAGICESYWLIAIGGMATGTFMALSELGWGLLYYRDGARSATAYVAGGFACAPLIDIPLLLMLPQAQGVFFALAPLVSGACLALAIKKRPPENLCVSENTAIAHGIERVRHFFHRYLGISAMLLCAVVLVMTGFGYLQHFISFSSAAYGGSQNGIGIQIARGLAAMALFCVLALKPMQASAIYRTGFLVMIAGIMTMSFTFATPSFLASGMLVIIGYTVFDLFMWVAFSHIARTQSKNSLKTIAVMRLFASLCAAVGCAGAIALSRIQDAATTLASQETAFVGYLVVIATVLLISSEDARGLLRSAQAPLPFSKASPEEALEQRVEKLGNDVHLTSREKDIALLLIQGRTQPRIAEMLGISENTVGTHVRHIYRKADIHDRQQLIDLVLSSSSPETHEDIQAIADKGL